MRIVSPAVAAALVVLGLWTANQLNAPVIATVDLERVFNEFDARNDEEGKLAAKIEEYKAKADALRAEAQSKSDDLELLVPGTDKYDEAEKAATQAALDYKAAIEFARYKGDSLRAEARVSLFDQIIAAAMKYAQDNGIDIIITSDSNLPIQEGSDMQIVQQLALRRIVYAGTAYDITDELITVLNAP